MQFTTTLLLGGKTATGIRVPDRYPAGTASGGLGGAKLEVLERRHECPESLAGTTGRPAE